MRKVKVTRVVKAPGVAEPVVDEDEEAADSRDDQIMVRPDGYYWQTPDGKQEFGPFESLESALADRETADEQTPEPGETLQEALKISLSNDRSSIFVAILRFLFFLYT